jgi:hypothetical protein
MNKFVIALATVVSLGLAIPAFAEVPAERMGKHEMGKHDKMVVHYHHHYHHHMMKSEAKPQ